MSKQILIIGDTAAGKTTSLRHIDPSTTYIIDADIKGLNWRGWRYDYSKEQKNYTTTSSVQHCRKLIEGIIHKLPHVKTIVIDTVSNLMVADEIHSMQQKGYDKWIDLTQNVFDLITYTSLLPNELTFIYVGLASEEDGKIRLRTTGKKLGKIELESRFNIVILMDKSIAPYQFILKHEKSTARVPLDFLDNQEIVPANIASIIEEMEHY